MQPMLFPHSLPSITHMYRSSHFLPPFHIAQTRCLLLSSRFIGLLAQHSKLPNPTITLSKNFSFPMLVTRAMKVNENKDVQKSSSQTGAKIAY